MTDALESLDNADPATKLAIVELLAAGDKLKKALGDNSPFFMTLTLRSPFADKSAAYHRIKCKARELPELLTAHANMLGELMEREGLGLSQMLPKKPDGAA
jgi:hypothetical protein